MSAATSLSVVGRGATRAPVSHNHAFLRRTLSLPLRARQHSYTHLHKPRYSDSYSASEQMKAHASLTLPSPLPFPGNLCVVSPRLQFRAKINHSVQPLALAFLNRNASFRFSASLKAVVEAVRFDGPVVDPAELEDEDCEVVIEMCITRTLHPAVTLETGIQRIKGAVEELKLNPPSSSSGVFRFQVAVPPSPKALIWFCSQPESAGVFPRFFVSNDTENPSCKSLFLNGTRGVFGIGAAIYFVHSNSSVLCRQSSVKRYLSSDLMMLRTYGFMDVNCNTDSSTINHEAGSSFFLIPEIELEEHIDVSVLSVTVAWDDAFSYTFKQAIQSFESVIGQVGCQFLPTTDRLQINSIRSALRKVNLVEAKSFQMVYTNALLLEKKDCEVDPLELRGTTNCCQFCFKLSPTSGVSSIMLDHARETSCYLQDHANINAVWASIIVEECTRLGLTYFCVAPGSRSSLLAIAASTHHLITCIPCFDERSLAFHAVGYARGSHKPAVIITTSGTAVSNLLPAVVEASQDFVPLVLLTADRPPELHDVGANQAINQVNHFGSFTRYSFTLPPPTDKIPARMVLTTIDSAVHWATSSPCGPVHINCPFREPLDDSPNKWMADCLKGLNIWMSGCRPLTKYIQMQNSLACNGHSCGLLAEVLEIIQHSKRGLLLVGAIHSEDDTWAALLLAKHLNWPVVADILSGLRLRKLLSSFAEVEGNIFFIDHLDHALLSDAVRGWVQFDAIVQIGSRITSKRVAQMLEERCLCPYILVDNHPYRHDPSHLITHRVQCSILQFSDHVIKARFLYRSSKWCYYLQQLDKMVAWDIAFQIHTKNSLTEPHVVNAISKYLSADSAIFVGNSMVIRDVDMYGQNCADNAHRISDMMLHSELTCQWTRVAGNRGASGIDGLLSSAVGFAIGCGKQVFCLIGDVSFLHDTNGLTILKQRMSRKPMTILVINNQGGAIFSLLPLADGTDPGILNQFFYTSHNTSIYELCMAHGVKHLCVKTKVELQDALVMSQHEKDCVIEVKSCIDDNSAFHSLLRKSAACAADHALSVLSRLLNSDGFFIRKITKMEYCLYRIQLCAPSTSSPINNTCDNLCREGYILSVSLEDGSVGYGEVSPLEIHKENLLDVEEQLRFLVHVIQGTKISSFLPLLNGSFTSWIRSKLGIPECSIFSSVRCGLEMAILNALALTQDSSLLCILRPLTKNEEMPERPPSVKICALVDSNGTPTEVAYITTSLIEEGFTTIKFKVARRRDPAEDAAVIQEVRKKVGKQIAIRVDANRKWTYEEAIQFGTLVKDCDLQYIEEPVQDEDDIIKYSEETGLPVALDETIGNLHENPLDMLAKYTHPGIVALVIKPSVIGGFEKAALIARWAQQQGKMAVVSAAFESGLGLSTYILFSHFLELQNVDLCNVISRKVGPSIAHGLGTYRWLKQDVACKPLKFLYNHCGGFVGASVGDATHFLQKFQINHSIIQRNYTGEQVRRYHLTMNTNSFSCAIKVYEVGWTNHDNVVVFLHGFLGNGEDWIPILKAISGCARCISFDLPGHGESKLWNNKGQAKVEATLSIETISDMLYRLIQEVAPGNFTIVGYSMGARIALHMALRLSDKINGAVIISGSPGLKDLKVRKFRQAKDDARARFLITYGLGLFLDAWYAGELWKSWRSHPHFKTIVASRLLHNDVHGLARVLSDLSIGRQLPLWEDLEQCKIPLLLIVGNRDGKFKEIAQRMHHVIGQARKGGVRTGNNICEIVEVPKCGHAVHLENPLSVIRILRQFLTRLRTGVVA